MKKLAFTLALAFGISFATSAQQMSKPQLIKAEGKIISLKPSYSSPVFYDLDKDGKKELIVGTFYGDFRIYKNEGSIENPIYNTFIKIKADGKDAKTANW